MATPRSGYKKTTASIEAVVRYFLDYWVIMPDYVATFEFNERIIVGKFVSTIPSLTSILPTQSYMTAN